MKDGCFGNRGGTDCAVLSEKLCEKQGGVCKFFATKEQVAGNRARAEEALSKKGLYPRVKRRMNNGVTEEIQSVSPIP